MNKATMLKCVGVGLLMLGCFGPMPAIAQTQSRHVSFTVNADGMPNFWQVMADASTLVAAQVTQIFTANPSINRIDIEVLAERNGAIAPLMVTQISRAQWQADAQIDSQTRYFRSAQVLLSYTDADNETVARSPLDAATTERLRQSRIQLEDALD